MEMVKRNKTIDSYNRTAREYYSVVSSFDILPEMFSFVNMVKPGGKILDLGCGPGQHSKYFKKFGFKTTGVDLSEEMINIANQENAGIDFKVMDIEKLNFPDSFDGIWASASLLHIRKRNLLMVLGQILNFLKADGVFYLSMKNGIGEKNISDNRYGGVNKFYAFYSVLELEKILKIAGFKIIQTEIKDRRVVYDTNSWIHVFCKKDL